MKLPMSLKERSYEGLRYVIRDSETKIPLVRNKSEWDSDSVTVINLLYHSMNFGLKNYYEIFDRKKKEVIS